MKKRASNQDRSRHPRQGARQNSTQPTPPFRERSVQALLLSLQEPEGSSWRFVWKQILDAHSSFKLSVQTMLQPRLYLDPYRLSKRLVLARFVGLPSSCVAAMNQPCYRWNGPSGLNPATKPDVDCSALALCESLRLKQAIERGSGRVRRTHGL